jgi:hypothetical protein
MSDVSTEKDANEASDRIFRIAEKSDLVAIVWSAEDVHKSIAVLGYKPITHEAAITILMECAELLQEICGDQGQDVLSRQIEYLARFGLAKVEEKSQ